MLWRIMGAFSLAFHSAQIIETKADLTTFGLVVNSNRLRFGSKRGNFTQEGVMWYTRFRVAGHFQFPLDMLRYDSCWPASQEDVCKLSRKAEGILDLGVELLHADRTRAWKPTDGRWQSFGWRVVPGSVSQHKI